MSILSRVSTLMQDIDITILPVHHVPIFCQNGSIYCHSFFTTW